MHINNNLLQVVHAIFFSSAYHPIHNIITPYTNTLPNREFKYFTPPAKVGRKQCLSCQKERNSEIREMKGAPRSASFFFDSLIVPRTCSFFITINYYYYAIKPNLRLFLFIGRGDFNFTHFFLFPSF